MIELTNQERSIIIRALGILHVYEPNIDKYKPIIYKLKPLGKEYIISDEENKLLTAMVKEEQNRELIDEYNSENYINYSGDE